MAAWMGSLLQRLFVVVVLTAVYYLLVTPVAMVLRLAGRATRSEREGWRPRAARAEPESYLRRF